MRKFLLSLILIFILAFAPSANAVMQDMWAYVYSWNGQRTARGLPVLVRETSGITFQVLRRNTDTEETLYYFRGTTSLTNVVTTTSYESASICNDQVKFRVDPAETNDRYVDLIVINTDGGYTVFVEDFDKYSHTIVIDERPNVMHHGMAYFDYSFGSATEIDTGINFQYDTIIHDVRVETVTADSGITIEVGLQAKTGAAGDADGFIDARSVAAAGYTKDSGVITNGASIDYTPDSTYGDLLYTIIAGSDVYATNGGRTFLGHVVDFTLDSASDLSYTLLTAANTANGYIHVWFTKMR